MEKMWVWYYCDRKKRSGDEIRGALFLSTQFVLTSICCLSIFCFGEVGDSSHGQWLMIAMPDNSRYCHDWL